MDWVDKYITKIEDQGCTRISCINRGLFDMHPWKETPYETTLWMVYFSLEEVADKIPYGSKNKSLYSSIDWVDRNIFRMKTLGGKEFYFCNKIFVVTDIVLHVNKNKDLIFSHWMLSIHMHMR